jgi:hypothetical protein
MEKGIFGCLKGNREEIDKRKVSGFPRKQDCSDLKYENTSIFQQASHQTSFVIQNFPPKFPPANST